MLQAILTALNPLQEIHDSRLVSYWPTHLTHISKIYNTGQVDLQIHVYFPGIRLEAQGSKSPWIQVKVGRHPWENLSPPKSGQAYWSRKFESVFPGTPVRFRYRDIDSQWQPITPLVALERVYETIYLPNLKHKWQHTPPKFEHGRVLLETTLEGLLAGYAGGVMAPRSREELFRNPIAREILKTDIPGILSDWAIDEVMLPTNSSVADRAYLNPKFNYLTYDVADFDWQLGQGQDFMKLIDRLYGYGISIVPDLSFVHQVSQPFKGSLDQIIRPDTGENVFVDSQAFQFRDYGTWLFRLEDTEVRRQLVEKIVSFVAQYHLKMIRLDYLDGLILQYSKREINFGAVFLQELKASLKSYDPEVRILGETFEVGEHIVIKECIDIFYAPFGFTIIEELCKPPSQRNRPLFPEIERLVADLNYATQEQRRNALYVQLHDETCYDEHIAAGRPRVPWAYGKNPAQLAKNEGEELMNMGLLKPTQLLDYVHRIVRNTEALTMFSANLLYMFVPAVDSLSLGGLDEPDKWKVDWQGVHPNQLAIWQDTGLSEAEILRLHDKHRTDMIELRNIFRRYTPVAIETLQPLTNVKIYHVDPDNAVIVLLRRSFELPSLSMLVVFNLGANSFQANPYIYELPISEELQKNWEVLFDGDGITSQKPQLFTESYRGYEIGTRLQTSYGKFLNGSEVLQIKLAARSLVILKSQ